MKRSVPGALITALAFLFATSAQAATPKRVCPSLLPGFMHCDAYAKPHGAQPRGSSPLGYGPADLQSAYALADKASTGGTGKTIAIVDAYDNPNAESDLATYRSYYGLPACTTANGCFKKVNQTGGSTPPAAAPIGPNGSWADETSLDLDMASAICPNCKILLVEANADDDSLFTAVDYAASVPGVSAISNSWGGGEVSLETYYESYFNHPGIPITVSSGDSGYGVEYPAASAYATAVGGTSLLPASNARGWSETAWDGAGSGCSLYIDKPAWQGDSGCSKRTVADVSAVADPNTGVAVYDTYDLSGWQEFGGTSAAAPIVAAAYALLGSPASSPSFPYTNPAYFNDVTSGSNGLCSTAYLCNGVAGFDGPTGVGTPNLAQTGDGSAPPPSGGSGGTTGSPPPPPPAVQPFTPPGSSVAVSNAALKASRSGTVRIRVSCGNGAICAGVLTLQLRLHGSSLKTVGKGRYHVSPGSSKVLKIKLSKTAMRRLKQKRRLRIYGTALDSDGTTAQASLALHAPKRPKRHRHR